MLLAGILCSCSSEKNNLICPLPSGIDINALEECTIPARFTAEDFNWRGSNLSLTAFSEDLYDAVAIHEMKVGDTLLYDGNKIVVESITNDNGYITVNGDIDEGGACLQAYEGGTYRATTFDDHSLYTELGEVEVLLSEDFKIIDCGENPTDPSDTISTDQKLYIESLELGRTLFFPINTRVTINGGRITEITRVWIP